MSTTQAANDSVAEGLDPVKPERFWALAVGSAGVVFGDIGTSPLYAFKESIAHLKRDSAGSLVMGDVFGVISLMVWTLIVIVLIKYVLLLMRMDNKGEGGTLSLMALLQHAVGRRTRFLFLTAVCSAGLFFGDALLTPAVSVLSAVEGLTVIPELEGRIEGFILPLALIVLVVLFLVQRRGTETVGALFGPICILWFAVLAALGVANILRNPDVIVALSPHHAIAFLFSHGILGFTVLGSVFLTVTGAEALYADMGHFGRKPIATTWIWLVMPCLMLNYLGQGALVLSDHDAIDNPFFKMAPEPLLAPLVILATLATVIASQAVISGAFSLTQQAIQLGLLPRLRIVNTSAKHIGQIYIPQVNYILMIGVILLVALFKSSSALASAYGVSVIGAMITSSLLAFLTMRRVWRKSIVFAAAIVGPLLVIEGTFLASNLMKIASGGYVPLLIAAGMMVLMWTWARGSRILTQRTSTSVTVEDVFAGLSEGKLPKRVPGTAIFLTSDPSSAPSALLHNLKHNKVLHEHNVILTAHTAEAPRVPDEDKVTVVEVKPGLERVTVRFGYMETPNITHGLALARKKGLTFDIMQTSFFLSRHSPLADGHLGMPLWQDHLFIYLHRNAARAVEYFHIPFSRVVELGNQVLV